MRGTQKSKALIDNMIITTPGIPSPTVREQCVGYFTSHSIAGKDYETGSVVYSPYPKSEPFADVVTKLVLCP